MLEGIDRDCPIVLNLDEKMTALAEDVNSENMANLVSRTLVSLIGEDSNAATCYHNKPWKSTETKEKYEKYIDILSIVNSFAIDFAKTGYIMNIPYEIAKYSKPYPYFMRYISDYYENLYQSMERNNSSYRFQKSKKSNMNQLSFMMEKFHNKEIRWKKNEDFDYSIMIDKSIPMDFEKLNKIEEIYLDFNKEIKYLVSFEKKLHEYDKYKNELKAWDKESAINYHVNWDSVYSVFKKRCEEVCDNKKELANMCVTLCYEKYKSRGKKFMWAVSSSGILENIKQVEINIPIRDSNGELEYLGKKYSTYVYNG